jgi:transcriptional regulator with XRE-family HTH domain
VKRILEETGVGKSTLYRWVRGDWTDDPEAAKVRDFCDGLDIPPSAAFLILWPSKSDRAPMVAPAPMDPDVEKVLRRLADPGVPDQEKYLIRETIRGLASRPSRGPQRKAV